MEKVILVLILSFCHGLEVFRKNTNHEHITVSKSGDKLIGSGSGVYEIFIRNNREYSQGSFWNGDVLEKSTFELCGKPQFSENQQSVYYINSDLFLRQISTSTDEFVSNVNEIHPCFTKNKQIITVMSRQDVLSIFDETLLSTQNAPVNQLSPYYPSQVDPSHQFLRIQASSDGSLIALKQQTQNENLLYIYPVSNGNILLKAESNTNYSPKLIEYVWLDPSHMVVQSDNVNYQRYGFVDNARVTQESNVKYGQPGTRFFQISGNKQMVLLATDGVPFLMPNINVIRLYPRSIFLDNSAKPQLIVYEVGKIISIELNEDGSIISYIRKNKNARELVVLFHEVGVFEEREFVCSSQQNANRYKSLCSEKKQQPEVSNSLQVPFALQIVIIIIVFLLLFSTIGFLIWFVKKYYDFKAQIQTPKIQKQETRSTSDKKSDFILNIPHENLNDPPIISNEKIAD